MSFRKALASRQARGELLTVTAPISPEYEIAGLLKQVEPRAVLCEFPSTGSGRVAGNVIASKAALADYFGIPTAELIPTLTRAIQARRPAARVAQGACQEVIELAASLDSLDSLPILLHAPQDGGRYISAGVVIARHPQWGQNLDFHRAMQFSSTELALRVVRGRHFDRFLQELGALEVAICVGCSPAVLVAAATSVELGVDELEIANALEPLELVHAATVDLWVPAQAEYVLEGVVYRDRRHAEGPFIDLTETLDVVRQEPVFELRAITHRRDPIWHALLPGAAEHKLLMGMPREPTIFRKVNEVVRCLDVHINPGGCSWLHAVVQIAKQDEDDGRRAIAAAFAGHSSLKHVFVVDDDIDIYNPQEVEWALATRFQGDRDLVTLPRASGSSLDPSAEADTHLTTRLGFDLTRPLQTAGKDFRRVSFPQVDVRRFLGEAA